MPQINRVLGPVALQGITMPVVHCALEAATALLAKTVLGPVADESLVGCPQLNST